jgi:hypothetical protein
MADLRFLPAPFIGPGQTLRAPVGQTSNWYRYTFRISQTVGMEIYENDRLVGSDPSLTSP